MRQRNKTLQEKQKSVNDFCHFQNIHSNKSRCIEQTESALKDMVIYKVHVLKDINPQICEGFQITDSYPCSIPNSAVLSSAPSIGYW